MLQFINIVLMSFVSDLLHNWKDIVALIIGIYEVIVRIYPTTKNLSLIGKLLQILKYISDYLNVEKK